MSKHVGFIIEEEVNDSLALYSKAMGISKSQFVNEAIVEKGVAIYDQAEKALKEKSLKDETVIAYFKRQINALRGIQNYHDDLMVEIDKIVHRKGGK